MKKNALFILSLLLSIMIANQGFAQDKGKKLLSEQTFSGIEFRSIGPSFRSGRIADIAIHPENKNLWYVAAGSGGVWKTENSGTTWKAVFDKQAVYSIGCITIDPNNPHIVWVGSGENVGGRHVGYGDGIYRSMDGGETWKNMGLKASQHISKIIVHPKNSDILWVAAQGPLWNKGGERGLYKTTDGGKTWKKTLGDDKWVGVTDILIDPRNPDRLYAATWQRHRNVANYMGGGPGTAIYRSEDGGETWIKLTEGLPNSNMGKIGLAISPQKPDVIYAAIELDRRSGAVYRSSNRGASWRKQSDAVSGATGPHYYQELYASPHAFDRIYLVDVRIQVSDDGGKNFRRLKEEYKHSDNHVIVFREDEEDYLLVGTDGGIYESFDLAKNWRFITNLPLTQFYKVAVDDAEPFYNIYGGTQDNGTQGGPVRTDKRAGMTNEDWTSILFADGHQPATEPGNPDILYAEWQEGHLVRIDRTTGEITGIQPQPEEGEDYERFNWDAPILVSPHSPTRIYFASQRLWRSDDRGDSWEAVSGDLTKNEERMVLPIMDKTWSWDSPWDVNAMSNYNTITSLAESPITEGLIYAGTDDGLIQITDDGGNSWRKTEVGQLPGVPATAFVNDIKADLFDANTVYIALDNHKHGDLSPYLLKSTNRGKSWRSIKGNIPDSTLVWRFVQDHINPDLCFVGTEFGIYFTLDGGEKWVKFTGGLPTIPFRDLAIQKRENDLVGASFGRSFYVLDDYSFLRSISADQLKREATLFNTRDAWWYIPRIGKGATEGSAIFFAKNPPFGAVFTYYLSEGYQTKESKRKEAEKEKIKKNEEVVFPGWDAVENERIQAPPKIWLSILDSDGKTIRRLSCPATKGFHRIAWDLSYPQKQTIDASRKVNQDDYNRGGLGMVQPGIYTAGLSKEIDGVVTPLSDTITFKVIPLRKGVLEGPKIAETVAFWQKINNINSEISLCSVKLKKGLKRIDAMQLSLSRSASQTGSLEAELHQLKLELLAIERQMKGSKSRNEIGEKNPPTVYYRLRAVESVVDNSTYGPTQTSKRSLEIVQKELMEIKSELLVIVDQKIPETEKKLQAAGAPVVE
jgi:photosystem II stability/assembly factor-like uncharacterized protein